MIRHGVDPLVQCGVELGYDVLLPFLADKSEHDSGLVDRVLRSEVASADISRSDRLATYDSAKRKCEYLVQAQYAVEVRDHGRLSRWLLPGLRRILVSPILIVAFDGEVKIEVLVMYRARPSERRADEPVERDQNPVYTS